MGPAEGGPLGGQPVEGLDADEHAGVVAVLGVERGGVRGTGFHEAVELGVDRAQLRLGVGERGRARGVLVRLRHVDGPVELALESVEVGLGTVPDRDFLVVGDAGAGPAAAAVRPSFLLADHGLLGRVVFFSGGVDLRLQAGHLGILADVRDGAAGGDGRL